MFRPAHVVGVVRAIRGRHRAVGPRQAAFGWLIRRAEPRRGDTQDTAFAFHHHVSHISGGTRDDGEPVTAPAFHLRTHPFRARAGLAEAATREEEPDAPVARRRQLIVTRPKGPAVAMLNLLYRRQTGPVPRQ